MMGRLIAVWRDADERCDECNRTITRVYRVDPGDGSVLTLGSGCARRATGLPVTAMERAAAEVMRAAELERRCQVLIDEGFGDHWCSWSSIVNDSAWPDNWRAVLERNPTPPAGWVADGKYGRTTVARERAGKKEAS